MKRGSTRAVGCLLLIGVVAVGAVPLLETEAAKPPSKCPEPDPNAICILILAPVKCHGCTYSNSCFAGAAGWDPDRDCKPVRNFP